MIEDELEMIDHNGGGGDNANAGNITNSEMDNMKEFPIESQLSENNIKSEI